MSRFERINDAVYRLTLPFEEIYTSVFLLNTEKGSVVVDGGASMHDAERYVIPAIDGLSVKPNYILRSHCHGDHSGGVERIAMEYSAKIGLCENDFPQDKQYFRINDGDVFFDRFEVVELPGHTEECIGIYDKETKLLLSFDSLQGNGVGKYGVSFADKKAYIKSIERVRQMYVDTIIMSHEYEPLGYAAMGNEKIRTFLQICIEKARVM